MATSRHETALIVGAGQGLSASLARLFAREGMRVAVAARNTDKLAALCSQTGARPFMCDASRPQDVMRLFDEVVSQIGSPDVVVYNAGARDGGALAELLPANLAR